MDFWKLDAATQAAVGKIFNAAWHVRNTRPWSARHQAAVATLADLVCEMCQENDKQEVILFALSDALYTPARQ